MDTLQRDLAGSVRAHRRLEAELAGLSDDEARAPSRLDGWTVGHVLTHIARNADSFTRLCAAARRGEVAVQYPGGAEQRRADIEAGATRSAEELRRDVLEADAALEAAWEAMSAEAWRGRGDTAMGPVATHDLPFRRWRETVVHLADLGLRYGWRDWPDDYVRLELQRMAMLWDSRAPMGMTGLPDAVRRVDPHHRLAWLLGRADIDGLAPAGLMA